MVGLSFRRQIYSMPEFKEVENFIPENNHLHDLPLYQWGPLLFTQIKKGLGLNYFLKRWKSALVFYQSIN